MIDREDQLNLNLNPTPDPQYTFITLKNEYIVENNNKYAKKEKYLSTDGGKTFIPMYEYSKGELIEQDIMRLQPNITFLRKNMFIKTIIK